MDVSGNYTFDAPQKLVWEALQDPNVLGAILPGGQGITLIGENEYNGKLQIKVGPVQGSFEGHIKLSDIVAPESYKLAVDGKGAPGFVKANGGLKLEARGNQTYMDYSGSAQVGGKIASVGQRLIDSSARSIIRQSLDALNEYLKVKAAEQPAVSAPAAAPEPVPVAATVSEAVPAPAGAMPPAASSAPAAPPKIDLGNYKPPSQMQLMTNVAKDVFNDMVPAQYRPFVIGAVIVIIVLIVYAILPK